MADLSDDQLLRDGARLEFHYRWNIDCIKEAGFYVQKIDSRQHAILEQLKFRFTGEAYTNQTSVAGVQFNVYSDKINRDHKYVKLNLFDGNNAEMAHTVDDLTDDNNHHIPNRPLKRFWTLTDHNIVIVFQVWCRMHVYYLNSSLMPEYRYYSKSTALHEQQVQSIQLNRNIMRNVKDLKVPFCDRNKNLYVVTFDKRDGLLIINLSFTSLYYPQELRDGKPLSCSIIIDNSTTLKTVTGKVQGDNAEPIHVISIELDVLRRATNEFKNCFDIQFSLFHASTRHAPMQVHRYVDKVPSFTTYAAYNRLVFELQVGPEDVSFMFDGTTTHMTNKPLLKIHSKVLNKICNGTDKIEMSEYCSILTWNNVMLFLLTEQLDKDVELYSYSFIYFIKKLDLTALLEFVVFAIGERIDTHNFAQIEKLAARFKLSYLQKLCREHKSGKPLSRVRPPKEVSYLMFHHIYENMSNTDIKFNCGNRTVVAHSTVLNIRMPNFIAVMTHSVRENGVINVLPIANDIFEFILYFAYTGVMTEQTFMLDPDSITTVACLLGNPVLSDLTRAYQRRSNNLKTFSLSAP